MNDEKIRELMEENARLKKENKRLRTLYKSKRVEFSKVILR